MTEPKYVTLAPVDVEPRRVAASYPKEGCGLHHSCTCPSPRPDFN
jgi:hypothetical protein